MQDFAMMLVTALLIGVPIAVSFQDVTAGEEHTRGRRDEGK
jgi:hypothetical protein